MNETTLAKLAKAVGGRLQGSDTAVHGISIDSRTLCQGDLFVAVKGANFDGHDFVEKAVGLGASAVLVACDPGEIGVPRIVVQDTFVALGLLGEYSRLQFAGAVLAVTGTCGKTSVKEMLFSVLSCVGETWATQGNLNNGYGVPITLWQLSDHHRYAVIELGTSSPGEIAYVTGLTHPDLTIITNASENHLEGLGSLEGVIEEKGAIVDGLGESGIAVLNLDDPSFERWRDRALARGARRVVTFSLANQQADAFASDLRFTETGSEFTLNLRDQTGVHQAETAFLAFWGQHQVQNACCVAATVSAMGLSIGTILGGLKNARPFDKRGQRHRLNERTVLIDETYNASPAAMKAAIDQLAGQHGKRVLVIGDMLELGDASVRCHEEVGRYASEKGIDFLLACGSETRHSVRAFGESGLFLSEREALVRWLWREVDAARDGEDGLVQLSILVKGSRSMNMSDVVLSLLDSDNNNYGEEL